MRFQTNLIGKTGFDVGQEQNMDVFNPTDHGKSRPINSHFPRFTKGQDISHWTKVQYPFLSHIGMVVPMLHECVGFFFRQSRFNPVANEFFSETAIKHKHRLKN